MEEKVSFEIKLLLDAERVLDEGHLFTKEFLDLFDIQEGYQPIKVLFLETKDRIFHQEGWINRIRWREGKEKAECTFKKRYPVLGEDIAAALANAAQDGFSLKEKKYSTQIDWGYSGMKLSFSFEESGTYLAFNSLDQLSLQGATNFLGKEMPKAEANWKEKGWGKKALEQSQIIGSLCFLRARGSFAGSEVKAEIWPVPKATTADVDTLGGIGSGDEADTTYICEVSIEAEGLTKATALRTALIKYLDEKGVLLHEDSLKTQIMLDAYLLEDM